MCVCARECAFLFQYVQVMVLAIDERACLFIDQLDRFDRFVYILSDALCQNLVFFPPSRGIRISRNQDLKSRFKISKCRDDERKMIVVKM